METFDTNLFLLLNGNGGPVMDSVMHILSGRATWIPLYLLILWMAMRRYGWRYSLALLAVAAIGVAACDQTCNLLKEGLKFLRPTHTPAIADLVHTVNGYHGGLYGTASSHAANSLVLIIISSAALKDRRYIATMSLWLLAVCYSRIYLGVHFPSQILFGLLVGTLFGTVLRHLFAKYAGRLKRETSGESHKEQ